MMEMVVSLVIYLAIGWYIANLVDSKDTLTDALVTLFWPLVVVLGLFIFILLWM